MLQEGIFSQHLKIWTSLSSFLDLQETQEFKLLVVIFFLEHYTLELFYVLAMGQGTKLCVTPSEVKENNLSTSSHILGVCCEL